MVGEKANVCFCFLLRRNDVGLLYVCTVDAVEYETFCLFKISRQYFFVLSPQENFDRNDEFPTKI